MQLDIFEHSRDTMLRNDVALALERRDAAAAQAAWQVLAAEFPHDDALAALQRLIDSVERGAPPAFTTHEALRKARRELREAIAPAAQRVFGDAGAERWLAACWRELAAAARALPFDAGQADEHPAPLWLQLGDHAAAADAVQRIESWRRIPAPLAWMAEARHGSDGLHAAWPLLAELAWLAPARFDELTRRLPDPVLQRLRKAFDANFDASVEGDGSSADLAWLPAWLLTEQPALAAVLGTAQPSLQTAPEVAMRLLLELLGLERAGRHHALIERRRALRDTHAGLYAAYMKTR